MNCLRPPKLVLLLLFLCSAFIAQAQKTIAGTLVDSKTNEPIANATIKVKNGTQTTKTDAKGAFTLVVPSSESILTITHVSYAFMEVKVGETNMLSLSMTPSESQMDDVIVVGYGTKKRVNIQGAVSTIKGEVIEDIPVANLPSALVNRIPGVGVNFSSGKPGSTTTINIRNSITFPGAPTGVTSQPLIVIDGIISNPTQWAQAPNADWFENLDASQIEDITFLKDASAAIYGAAGAKGVVLITTKKGKAGKPKISYSGYFGVSTPAVKSKTLTAYEHAKYLNDGYELTQAADNLRFSQADLDSLKGIPDEAWFDYFWKNGKVTRHTLNVSGGTDKISLFAGGSYYNEKGNYGIVGTNKYSFRTGLNATVADGVTATVSFASDFSEEESNNWKNASTETDDATIRALYLTPKWVPVEIDGNAVGFGGNAAPNNSTGNPWSMLGIHRSGTYRDAKSQGLAVNASVEWKPKIIKGLAFRVQYGNNTRTNNSLGYYPTYLVYQYVMRGQNGLLYSKTPAATPTRRVTSQADQIEEGITTSKNYQFITTAQYARKFGSHDVDFMVGFDQGESESKNYLLSKSGQIVAGVDEFWAFSNDPSTLGSIQDALRNPQFFKSAKRSYLGRANYSFKGKYFFEFIGRADASVNFLPSRRWGFFPTVGLGWKISDESFFQNIEFVNNLKLRATYGIVGEDRVGNRLWESRFTQTTGAVIGQSVGGGLDPNIYPNPDITWEKSRTVNVGVDATVLNNKINITADFYHRYTYDGFDTYSTSVFPPTAGIPPPVINYGRQISWGAEFAVGYRGKAGKNWGYNADINFGWTNSQLLQSFYNEALLGNYGPDQIGIAVGRDPRRYNSSNTGYIAKGILRTQADVDAVLAKNPNYLIGGAKPQVGFMDFEDINGDGKIDDNDITLMFDRTTPIVGFGITLGASYKEFRFQMNLNLSIGGKRFYDSEARKVPTTTQNAPAFWADHWTPENPNGKYPRADAPLARENSTFWAVNGTQSRINNAVLSYQMPKRFSSKLRIPDLRVMVTGTNLWSLVNPLKYKDPYVSNFASYPTLRTISVGVNATL